MKLLWITNTYPSEKNPGAGVFFQNQADALKEEGVDLDIVSPIPHTPKVLAFHEKYKRLTELPVSYQWNGIDIIRPNYIALPRQLKWFQPHKRFAASIHKVIKKRGLDFDAFHAHFAMPCGGAAAILSQIYNKPYILTLHGSDVNVYPKYSRSAMNAFKFAVQHANHVLSVSGNLSENTFKLSGKSPTVLPIGINMKKFSNQDYSKGELRTKLNLPTDKKILLYVGRLVKEKGIQELLKMITQLEEDYVLVLVGDGPMLNEIKKMNLERLITVGAVDNRKVINYMSSSDILLLPSYSEGMPTVVIEALALKIPVIATHVGGLPSLFDKHRDLLIAPKSVDQIVHAVHKITSFGEDEKDEIMDYLHKKVEENFDVRKSASKLKKIYTNMLVKSKLDY